MIFIFVADQVSQTMDIEYVDILTGEKLFPIVVADINIIYWSLHLSSRGRVDGLKELGSSDF